jgi:hypothetical protein
VTRGGRPVEQPTRAERIEGRAGPLTGLVGALLTGAGLVMSDVAGIDAVNPDAPAVVVAAAIAYHRSRLHGGSIVLMVGLFLLVCFLVYLPQRLDPDGDARWMAPTASAGGLITVTLMALIVAYVRVAVQTTFEGADAVIPRAIALADWDYWRTFAPFIAAHMIGAGVVLVRTATPSRVLGWGAITAAALPLVLPPGLMTIVFLLWLMVLSIALLIRPMSTVRSDLPR